MTIYNKKNVALIDIGSNSICLIIYREIHRAPVIIHSEKVFCGLAQNLSETGKIDQRNLEKAEKTDRKSVV